MQLSLPVLVVLAFACLFAGMYAGMKAHSAIRRPANQPISTFNQPSTRRTSGCILPLTFIVLLLAAGWFVVHSGSFSLTLPNNLTAVQQSLQSVFPPSNASYQSLPIPKTAYQKYVDLAQKDATAVGLVPAVFIRQINQESGFNPNVTGAAGEIGIAQFMPETARSLGINAHDPVAALNGAAHLMASYLKTFNGDYEKALAAYNAGAGTVQNAVAKDGTNWKQAIPLSTQQYIATILNEGA